MGRGSLTPALYRRHGLIDAVIVDYGTPELALDCLASLRRWDGWGRIDVVDAKARGWSYATSVNQALLCGASPVVLALNADTRMLYAPNVELGILTAHPDVAVVGPRQVDDEGNLTHAGIFGPNDRPCHRLWQAPLRMCGTECEEPIADAATVSGAVFFARRAAWESLNGFLETPHYYEETWFCYLARHRGWRVVYTGATTWIHLWARSPVGKAELAERCQQSRELFRVACSMEGILCD